MGYHCSRAFVIYSPLRFRIFYTFTFIVVHRSGPRQTRLNVDLTPEDSKMVEFLKDEYGLTYGAELVKVLRKQAYDRSQGPYCLKK